MAGQQTTEEEFATAFDDEGQGAAAPTEDADGLGVDIESAETGDGDGDEGVAMEPGTEEAPEIVAMQGQEQSEQFESVKEVAKAVESGEMSVEDAVASLTDDFGPEFPRLLHLLIKAEVKNVSSTVDELIADIVDSRQRAHFEAIADAHPDFMDVANGDIMKNYLESLPEDQRAEAQNTIERGATRKVIALLTAAKAASGTEDGNDTAMDAAEGVRSGGLRIPDQPKDAKDFARAWDQF